MGKNCWIEYGSPQIKSEVILYASSLINRVFEYSEYGGNLHVQLDDWNIEDRYWEMFKKPFHDDTTQKQFDVETRCVSVMKILTLKERASALGLSEGFWSNN